MLKFIDVEQNTREWHNSRLRKITASQFAKIMAKYPNALEPNAKQYAFDIAWERVTGGKAKEGYSNKHMQRGHDQEPAARAAYEVSKGFIEVTNGGFWCNDDIGVSPDGMVDDNGVIEIKCQEPFIHFETIRKGGFSSTYKWQLIGNMHYTGRDYIDFVSYSPDYIPGREIYIHRLYKKDFYEEIKALEDRVSQTLILVDKNYKILMKQKG